MTTIFAVIVSGVLLCTGVDSKESSIRTQVTRHEKDTRYKNQDTRQSAGNVLQTENYDSLINLEGQNSHLQTSDCFSDSSELKSISTKEANETLLFNPKSCIITDETVSFSKFIVVLKDSTLVDNELKTCTLHLTFRSNYLNELNNGEYLFSNLIIEYSPTMSFTGYLMSGVQPLKITDGTIKVIKTPEEVTFNYHLKLDNQNILSGKYVGEYINRVSENIKNAIPTDSIPQKVSPIAGDNFILKLSVEELEKIGFQFTDTSIVFENSFDNNLYKYGSIRRKEKGIWKFDGKKRVLVDESGFNYAYDQLTFTNKEAYGDSSKNHFDYYPICTTNTYFTNYLPILRYNDYLPAFEMLNDTLLPIIFPSLDSVPEERIIWFVLTESLYNLLKHNHKAVLDELIKYKRAKKYHRYKDLVVYKSPFQIDKSRVIKLGNRELEKLGFKFYDDSTVYHGRWSNYGNSMVTENGHSSWDVRNDLPKIDEKEGSIAFLASTGEGSLLGYGNKPFLSFETDKNENIIPTLIPVSVEIFSSYYRNVFFWFLPTEGFFNALPDSIGKDLRKEYNYITAEDKSALEKPECKYFDECKNTLKVSSFKVYPNPANNQATVSFTLPESIDGRITLIDLMGRERKVLQPNTNYAKGAHLFEVDLSNVPEGIYLIALYSSKGIQTQRLIVAR